MAFDIKAKVEEIVNKVKNDKEFGAKFKTNPKGAVKDLLGINIPDEQIDQVINAVKAKLGADNLQEAAGKLGNMAGGLFGKK